MKKTKFLSVAAILAGFATMAGNPLLVNADSGSVPTTAVEAWKIAGGWEVASSYEADGIKAVVKGADTVGDAAWQHRLLINNNDDVKNSFSLKNNEKISFEFSAKLFESDGTVVSKSRNSNALDIFIHNGADDSELALLRIWTDSAGATNGSHSCVLYGPGWSNEVNASVWIKGDATAESSFFIQFDKENLFSSYVGGSEVITRLDNGDGKFLADQKAAFANVDEVYFVIKGDNGFTNNTEFVVKSINGQSLANAEGNIDDAIAPKFIDTVVPSTLNANEEYTIPTEAFDLFGGVTYSLKIGDEVIDGKTFTPTDAGSLTVTLLAKDIAGNVAEKSYEFSVVSNIEAPIITALPSIVGGQAEFYKTLTFDMPTFTDETNSAVVVLKLYKDEELVAELNKNDNNQFVYDVTPTFQAGDYSIVYEITNAGGTTTSEPKVVSYTTETLNSPDFITTFSDTTVADYVDAGIRVRADTPWSSTDFGVFDLKHGLDVKCIVDKNVSNGHTNLDSANFNLILVNAEDPNYKIQYRVWVKFDGADAPTNVYISTDGQNYTDITDTGWISRSVDGVDNQYHMAFNMEDTLVGERTGGMTRVDRAYDALVTFFNEAPSTNFHVRFDCSSLGVEKSYFEYVITSINGQSFANTNGTITTVNDAFLHVDSIAENVALDEEVTINAYSKDIFAATTMNLNVTDPTGATTDITFENGKVDYKFESLGNYKLVVSTVGSNGKTVSKEMNIVCKSSTQDVVLTVPSGYEANYDINDEITILGATYSDNVVTKTITVTKPDGTTITVNADDKFKFTAPGIYKITYTAADDAQPNPNEAKEEITINVPDTAAPVVTVEVNEQVTVNDKVTSVINVTDDSECDIKVTLEKPDSSVVNLSSTNNYEFTADVEGTYTLKVVVEDMYGNKETITKTITVTKNQPPVDEPVKKGCKGSATASVVSLLAIAGALVLKRKKNK